jgi:hypothetical protein
MLKSGKSATIIGTDPTGMTYRVMGSDNQLRTIKPTEIEKIDTKKYSDYQKSGPQIENPDSLSIQQKEVGVDLN